MKSEGKKTPLPLRYLCGILAVWTVLIGFSTFAGGRAGDGSIRIHAAALLLIVIPAAVFAISRLGTHCVYIRNHSGALRRGTALLCALALSLSAFTLPADAAATEGSLSDSNIGWSESDFSPGTPPDTGKATGKTASSSWVVTSDTEITGTVTPAEYSETSGSGCNQKTIYNYSRGATSTLTITNLSAEKRLLTFSYTVPSAGTLTIDERVQTKASSFSRTLDPNGTVLIKLTTKANPGPSTDSNPSAYAASATLSNLSLTSLNRDISVTFAQPAHGSYTVKAGSDMVKVGETCTKPVTTKYTLSARADANYVFDGWYVNHDTKVSVAATYTTAFSGDCTVEARFVEEPLFSIAQMSNTGVDKSAYVEVDSSYYHNEVASDKGSYHTNVGDRSGSNSYGPKTYFPDSTWSVVNGTLQSSASGTATGDYQNEPGYSKAVATLHSDIIRVKCKENCIISFDSRMDAQSISIMKSDPSNDQFGVFLYYYTTASANANADTIKANGTAAIKASQKTSGSATNTRVVVNKDQYLYLYAYGQTCKEDWFLASKGYSTDNYTYTATISNFTVTPNTTERTFTTGNRDNTEAILKYGSVKINGTPLDVSSGTNSYKAADGATLTLTQGNAPTGYTFIGWHNVTDNKYDYTNNTYTVQMTKDYTVYPIYVPAMTITADGVNATYKYKSLSGKMVESNGQFVARNADCSKFYTDLNAAFSDTNTNTVFLLAEDTINGSLTIPTNKTLVIPDRLADSGPAASQPEQVTTSAGISRYCKVTLNGNLTVNGKLVVNGMQSSTASGRAAGSIGYLSLSNDATITVSKGGELCGYGQIRGGSITAENDSTVRELMEISDRRAALVMNEIDAKKSEMRVFPFSNFSIKTIESPVTYAYGAKLYAQYSVMLEGNNHSAGAVLIFGPSGALFNLTKGSMTKFFDLAADKTVYRLNEGGKMSTGSFQLDVQFGVQGYGSKTITINSKDYWMPLNAGFDLRTAGDMTVNSDFKFLPGASLSVEKGGTCTVTSKAKLLFYRLNDYDTREIGKGEYQKGYSVKVYPVNATNLPGGGYKHPKLDTVGSARLNVDGEMIVKGGLYVSDDPVSQSYQGYNENQKEIVDGVEMTRKEINAAYFKVYPNGYNVLTGTGSIDMTAAQTSETQVHEAMTSQNTKDPAWAPINITPIKGLKADATVDNSDNYQPLTQATYYGVYQPGGFYTWTTEKPVVATIVGGGSSGTTYRSLAAAVAAYKDTGYIQMLNNSTEPGFTLDRDVRLDLNGKTVTLDGTLTVAEGKTLYGMDSTAGEDYVAAPSGKIVGTVKGCAPTYQTPGDTNDCYVAIQGTEADNETANLSFHRFNISVTGYRFELAAPRCALFFIGKFQGDAEAKNHLTELGFTLKDEKDRPLGTDSSPIQNPEDIPDMPDDEKESTSEVVRTKDGAFLFEAYLMRSFDKGNRNGYTEKIKAIAQATFSNGGTQDSEPKLWSFEDAWTEPKGLEDLTPKQREILDKFLTDLGINP